MSPLADLTRQAIGVLGQRLAANNGVQVAPSLDWDAAQRLLTDAVEAGRTRQGTVCPMSGVDEVLSLAMHPDGEAMIAAVRAHFDELVWFRNENVPYDFVARSCAAELVGPDGAFDDDRIRFGLFLIGGHADYPRHEHAATENYVVLAGAGEWTVDGERRHVAAGDVVHVESMQPHSIRTADSPVLMLYTWAGDVTFDTYRVG